MSLADTPPAPAENTAEKQRGRPFEPGQSGNPSGRPKGSRNRVTQAVEALIHGQAEALGAKAVEMALAGDTSMLRALLSTLCANPSRPGGRIRVAEDGNRRGCGHGLIGSAGSLCRR
jgi:hypothetical protein